MKSELVLRRGPQTLVTLTRKLSGRGKKYVQLVDEECEETHSHGFQEEARKKLNSAKPNIFLLEKNERCTNISKPAQDSGREDNDIIDVTVFKKRRGAICEEIERATYNNKGTSLRHYREFLVTHCRLKELNLM